MKPSMLSKDLKESLGMPEGAPPPWLINMQRYGPPQSYPHLKILGLNAPIPPGASFSYHPGGFPVDEVTRKKAGIIKANSTLREKVGETALISQGMLWNFV